ncbi:MAG: CDP-alcohol phosphatidyltransferase family protein [Verrucomicrobia bacterium]|nr:CDP-alcohol phosphatidyltransferase family protein [Verrucomicrobiota bacterium]
MTISNLLSACRLPLALLFLFDSVPLRLAIVAFAALTDYLDGFLARRWGTTSKFGAFLDPLMDKFFMLFVLWVLVAEGSLSLLPLFALLSRDLFLFGFLLYLRARKSWSAVMAQSLWWGKVITVLQYSVVLLLVSAIPIPLAVYVIFLAFSLLYLGELAGAIAHSRRDRNSSMR